MKHKLDWQQQMKNGGLKQQYTYKNISYTITHKPNRVAAPWHVSIPKLGSANYRLKTFAKDFATMVIDKWDNKPKCGQCGK